MDFGVCLKRLALLGYLHVKQTRLQDSNLIFICRHQNDWSPHLYFKTKLMSFTLVDVILKSLYGLNLKFLKSAWIAEWSSHSTFEHWYATPWAMSSSLGDVKLFWTQAQHLCFIHNSVWFVWFDTIICLSNLSCELWSGRSKIKEIYI